MADKLIVEIILEPKANDGSFKKVEDQATKSGKSAGNSFATGFSSQVGAKLKDVAKNVFGIALAFKAVSSAISGISASFENLRGFSRSIGEINSILPKTQKLTENTTQALIDFSRTFGTEQQTQAKAFYNIVSAGVKGLDRQLQTLAISNKAAVAGLVDIDTSARLLVSSVNAYSKSGLTAQKASDILFVSVREGQTTFGELAHALGNVTSIAANSGVEFEELAGALAFVTKSGIKTDVAATGLRQVFASIIKPSKEAADEAKRIGLEFNKTAIETKGLAGFLRDVQTATKGNEQSLAKLFGNIRALAPILNVVNGNFGDFERILKETKQSSGATSDAFDEIASSLDFKFDQVAAEFSAFGLNLLKVVNPALIATAGVLKNVGRALNSIFGVASTKPLDVTRKRISAITHEINTWMDTLKKAQAMPQKTLFGGVSASGKAVADIQTRIANLKDERLNLKDQMLKMIEDRKEFDESLKPVIANQEEEMSPPEITKADSILDYFQNISIGIDNLTGDAIKNMEKMKKQAASMANIMKNSLGKAISQGIQQMITNIGKGKDAFANFGKLFLGIIGDMAIKMGETLILSGLGIEALKGLGGSAAIAAGAGLVAIGTIIKNSAGGGDSVAGGGGGTAATAENDVVSVDDDEIDERQTATTINLSVEGSLVQQEELGSYISSVLSESNQKNSNVILEQRLA